MTTHIFGTRIAGRAMRFSGEFDDKQYHALVREGLPPGWAGWHSDSPDFERKRYLSIITHYDWSMHHHGRPPQANHSAVEDVRPILREWAEAKELARIEDESPYGLCRVCGKVAAAGLFQGLYLDGDNRRRPYRGYVDEQCAAQMEEDTGHLGRWSSPKPRRRVEAPT